MIYKEMKCKRCKAVFSCLIREGETPKCPECGSEEVCTNLSGGSCNRPGKSCSGNCSHCSGCH